MSSMFVAGTVCWVVAGVFGLWFAYETRKQMTRRGAVLKGAVSLAMTCYAATLIVMNGNPTKNRILFLVALMAATVGDVLIAVMQEQCGGDVQSVHQNALGSFSLPRLAFGVTGVLFIVSYFFQMVVFLKALSAYGNPVQYVIPFLVFFLVPPLFTLIGGILAKFRVPEVSTNIFIIGVFYILLTSALFASATVFAFALFEKDPNHAIFISVGAIMFFLSTLFVSLRYSNPGKYETPITRFASRTVTFLGRMILAGCAFLL